MGRFEESYTCLKELGRIALNDEYSFNNQGYLLLVQCSYGLQPTFEKPLLIRHPRYSEVVDGTITVDLDRGRKSLNALNKATALNPQLVLAWANKSFPAYYLKDYQSALNSCNKSLKLNPDNKQEMNEVIYTNKGYIQLKIGNLSEALQSFSIALSIDSELSEAWMGKGTVLCALNRYSEAFNSFTQAHNLDHPLAQRSLELAQQHLSQST